MGEHRCRSRPICKSHAPFSSWPLWKFKCSHIQIQSRILHPVWTQIIFSIWNNWILQAIQIGPTHRAHIPILITCISKTKRDTDNRVLIRDLRLIALEIIINARIFSYNYDPRFKLKDKNNLANPHRTSKRSRSRSTCVAVILSDKSRALYWSPSRQSRRPHAVAPTDLHVCWDSQHRQTCLDRGTDSLMNRTTPVQLSCWRNLTWLAEKLAWLSS